MAGEVIDVIDGKTVMLKIASGTLKVELQYIEVPSAGHEIHDRVVHHLKQLVLGKVVEYRPKLMLSDRTIGRILVRDADISQQMLRDGAAWHVAQELSGQDPAEYDKYAAMQAAAKRENRGLWSFTETRPPWEIRASNIAQSRANAAITMKEPVAERVSTVKPRGKWGDTNPNLGNVGALLNGFNAETQMGYLSTSPIGVMEVDQARAAAHKWAIDFTYIYKENGSDGRKGTFYFTVLSSSKSWRFAKNNDLTFLGDSAVIGRAARSTFIDRNGNHWEQLRYEISRRSMERIVNGQNVRLRIGNDLVEPLVGLQLMLYNMLQLSK